MIYENDIVCILVDKQLIKKGSIGTVVEVYDDSGIEVEFLDSSVKT